MRKWILPSKEKNIEEELLVVNERIVWMLLRGSFSMITNFVGLQRQYWEDMVRITFENYGNLRWKSS